MTNNVNMSVYTGFIFDQKFILKYSEEIDKYGYDDSMDMIHTMWFSEFLDKNQTFMSTSGTEEWMVTKGADRLDDIRSFLKKGLRVECLEINHNCNDISDCRKVSSLFMDVDDKSGDIYVVGNKYFVKLNKEELAIKDFIWLVSDNKQKISMPESIINNQRDYSDAQNIVERDIKDFSIFANTDSTFHIKLYHTDYNDEKYECIYLITKNSDRNHFGMINVGTGFVFLDARYSNLSFKRKLKERLILLMKHGVFNAIEVTTK